MSKSNFFIWCSSSLVACFCSSLKLRSCLKYSWLIQSYIGALALHQSSVTISAASTLFSESQIRARPTLTFHWTVWGFSVFSCDFIFSDGFNQYFLSFRFYQILMFCLFYSSGLKKILLSLGPTEEDVW